MMTPLKAYQALKEGNERFIQGQSSHRDLLQEAKKTAESATPFAVILTCMDSRTSPEYTFDQGIGNIFTIRIAGNIINDDILGGLEFGTELGNASLIAVIGHTDCIAIRSAYQQKKLGYLTGLLEKIKPAFKEINTEEEGFHQDLINQAAIHHVDLVMQSILAQSKVINARIASGKLGIIGGIQELYTGKVTFFEDKSVFPKNN